MSIKDVRVDTAFDLQTPDSRNKNIMHVVALKPCGCTGPLMGLVGRIRVTQWPAPSQLPERPRGTPEDAGLWGAYPERRRSSSAIALAWSPEDAAAELRSWWGMRNVRTAIRRSERKRAVT